MPRVTWPLLYDRPIVRILLTPAGGPPLPLALLADSGAGSAASPFDLILRANDCWSCGFLEGSSVGLSGAFAGTHLVFNVFVQIPALGYAATLPVIGVPAVPFGFDGTACFRFLNRFSYGNFGNPAQFGLER